MTDPHKTKTTKNKLQQVDKSLVDYCKKKNSELTQQEQLTRIADALEAKKPCTHCGDTVPPTHKVFCSDRCILDEAAKLPPFKGDNNNEEDN